MRPAHGVILVLILGVAFGLTQMGDEWTPDRLISARFRAAQEDGDSQRLFRSFKQLVDRDCIHLGMSYPEAVAVLGEPRSKGG